MDSLAVNKRMSDNTENEKEVVVGRRTDDICETLATALAAFKAQETFDEAEEAVLPCSARERCQYSRREKYWRCEIIHTLPAPPPLNLDAFWHCWWSSWVLVRCGGFITPTTVW